MGEISIHINRINESLKVFALKRALILDFPLVGRKVSLPLRALSEGRIKENAAASGLLGLNIFD